MVLVKLMKGSGPARKYAARIPGSGSPAFALLDPQGMILASWRGFDGASGFVATLKHLRKDWSQRSGSNR